MSAAEMWRVILDTGEACDVTATHCNDGRWRAEACGELARGDTARSAVQTVAAYLCLAVAEIRAPGERTTIELVNEARAYRNAEAAYWVAWQRCNDGTPPTGVPRLALDNLREALAALSSARWALDTALREVPSE